MTRSPTYQRLCAADELTLFRRSIKLLPALARRGVSPVDALSVAYNATFLYYHMRRTNRFITPKKILKRFPLSELARICGEILGDSGFTEGGVNKNWREDFFES